MTKRKKAKTTASRPTRGEHPSGPPGAASTARATVESSPTPTATGPLALQAECLVSGASALKASLASRLNDPHPITLDISALQRIDTAGLQVLTAFIRERASHDRAVEWRGTATALTSAAQLLGLTSLLRLPA